MTEDTREPKPRRKDTLRRMKAHGDSLREWLHDREMEATKRDKAAAKKRREEKEDRRPAHIKDTNKDYIEGAYADPARVLIEHFDTPRRDRRLRRHVSRDSMGHSHSEMRPGTNQPYYSEARRVKKAEGKNSKQRRKARR